MGEIENFGRHLFDFNDTSGACTQVNTTSLTTKNELINSFSDISQQYSIPQNRFFLQVLLVITNNVFDVMLSTN